MRILYVSQESPIYPGGGAATYMSYMAKAMADAGHEVFLFTWRDCEPVLLPDSYAPFKEENVHIEFLSNPLVQRLVPWTSTDLSLSTWLAQRIEQVVQDWNIDVVESTDFFSPALSFFQSFQSKFGNAKTLCVTYHHGFIEDIYEAGQMSVPISSQLDLLGERQQCRISDLVIAPSHTAKARLASYSIHENVAVVREPYRFDACDSFKEVTPELNYMGRISIQKGIDKLIYFANITQDVLPLTQIKLIGRVETTPFRNTEMKSYILSRFAPELRDLVVFTGHLQRDAACKMLKAGSISPHLGSLETFSYACIEAIDQGCLPIIRAGTAMAEFIPPQLQHLVLDERMAGYKDIQRKYEMMLTDAPSITSEVQEFCKDTLDPALIAEQTTELYSSRLAKKRGRSVVSVQGMARLDDITILIPAFKPDEEFVETIDSLVSQNIGEPRVLICDDGTPGDAQHWFEYAKCRLGDCEIIRQPNSGLLGARNTLIEACDTQFSVFLDTDDLLADTALESLLEAYNHSPQKPDAVIPQRANFGENDEIILRSFSNDHLHMISNDFRMTALIKTEVLREIGFDATRRNGEGDDWVFWIEFTLRNYTSVLLPELEFFYRFRAGSMSHPWSMGQNSGTQQLLREVLQKHGTGDDGKLQQILRGSYANSVRAG